MHADLDLLVISVYCTADDLLPERRRNARRKLSDAEIVALCVAQVLMGIPSDRRFLRAARRQLGHLFPQLPSQDALHKRRARLAETIEWLRSWPTTLEIDGVLYCHATPQSDETIVTKQSPEERFATALAGVDARLVVAGHTHIQFRRGRFVNAGSVGMPYEGEVAAYWAVVGEDVDFRKTPFDVERAAAEIRTSGWPNAQEFVNENLLTAPSRAETIAYFESLV